ncbi:polyketide cyclase/dehydrase and lipid transporter [Apiospora arundinis]
MATTSLRPCAQRLARNAPRAVAKPWTPLGSHQPRRTFLNIPGLSMPDANGPPQTLTARRTLPYASDRLYKLIADIDSYPRFLPYCTSARVTHWTNPSSPAPSTPPSSPQENTAEAQRRWPTQADLTAGWGGIEETYTSRVFCVPGKIVEAISGEAGPEIPAADLERLGLRDPGPRAGVRRPWGRRRCVQESDNALDSAAATTERRHGITIQNRVERGEPEHSVPILESAVRRRQFGCGRQAGACHDQRFCQRGRTHVGKP